MIFGIERLLNEPELRRPLAGRRVALLAHPASVTRDLTQSLDALAALPELNLSAAFGPQHALDFAQRDVRVFDNFQDPEANDNQVRHPNWPGYTGVELAVWKAVMVALSVAVASRRPCFTMLCL